MTAYYLDTSAVGTSGEYATYADAMVWGAGASDVPDPQDGNGKAQDAAAAV